MKIAHFTSGVVRLLFVIVTPQPPLPAARPMTPRLFPVVTQKLTAPAVGGVVHAVVAVYLTESAKYASSAVTRFRRSDFIEAMRSEEHTSELQSRLHLVCRLLLEKKKKEMTLS